MRKYLFKGTAAATRAKSGMKRLHTLRKPKIDLDLVQIVGDWNLRISSVVCHAISRQLGRMIRPRYVIVFAMNLHFINLKIGSAFCKSFKTLRTCLMCFSGYLEYITMSSKCSKAIYHFTAATLAFIVRWKVPEALISPKSMRVNQ